MTALHKLCKLLSLCQTVHLLNNNHQGEFGGMSTKNMKQAQTSAAISGQKTERKKRTHLLVLRGENTPRKLRNTRHEGEPITYFKSCFFSFGFALTKKKLGWDRDQYIYVCIYNYIYTYEIRLCYEFCVILVKQ